MENRYLSKYLFSWELIDLILGGKSALDSRFFMGSNFDQDRIKSFLSGYGLDYDNSVTRAELFGNFQEALQFIRRYFLKEGNENGLDLKIPDSILAINDVGDLFPMTVENNSEDEALWAEAVLKVMHTILHIDKDLRISYFQSIQTQIFDRFYKYLDRDRDDLFLKSGGNSIPLIEFETKVQKGRDSVIIKLLHKAENVAEELFDRIGVRVVTRSRFDALRVVKFLLDNFVIIPHNIKPSRSINSLIDLVHFRKTYLKIVKSALREEIPEEEFLLRIQKEIMGNKSEANNIHTFKRYQSFQFTCRQLIKHKNPFFKEFNDLRQQAKNTESDLAAKILNLDIGLISKEVHFFYPYEVQILDLESHKTNTQGEASHQEYKQSQIQAAMKRVFGPLVKHKNLPLEN